MLTCVPLSPLTGPLREPAGGRAEAAGIALGLAVDALIGDPRRGHPVAAFGRWSRRLQGPLERDSRLAGLTFWCASVGSVTALGALAARLTRGSAPARAVLIAWSTWAVIGGTTLGREASRIAGAVAADDIPAARELLPNLCGRDPSRLDGTALLRATIESVAENTGDAVVSPLLWGACLGAPGLLAFRALNTLDAVVGHRSERYLHFGWAAARLDDAASLVPARIGALLTCALAPVVGGRPGGAWRAWRRDAPAHPSPNAGPLEAGFAGALGLRLGGALVYDYGPSERPWLNRAGRDPVPADVARTVRLSRAVGVATAVLAGALAWRRG